MQAIGIFGGTFDPIHYGHLRPAQEILQALGLQEIRFIPAADPPHRDPPRASAAQRLHMVTLALAEFPGFRVDDREIRRPGPSYTVLTLSELRHELGATPVCLLLGMDAFLGLETWHRWQEIPELAHLVVMQRPGWPAHAIPDWARPRLCQEIRPLSHSPGGRIWVQNVTPQAISASHLRASLARGESVQGLLPEAVDEFICQNNIYSELNPRV